MHISSFREKRVLACLKWIARFDISLLRAVVQWAIIKYQVHKLLFNLTCVLQAINTHGATGKA